MIAPMNWQLWFFPKHSFPKLVNLIPNDGWDGIPMAFIKGIQCLDELVTPLCFMSYGAHITIQNGIHKLELWRQFGLVACIIFVISVLSRTHVFDDFGDIKGLRLCIHLCVNRGCSSLHFKAATILAIVNSTCFP
jgi:hypothetical protein